MTTDFPAPPINKILIVRLSAIGDIVMASGLIPALKARFPDSELYWLCDAPYAAMLAADPDLAGVITWPKQQWSQLFKQRQWRQLWRELRAFKQQLKAYQFDLTLDVQGLFKSGLLAYFTAAPQRFGFDSKEFGHIFATKVIHRIPEAPAMSSEYRQMAQALGCADEQFRLQLRPDSAVNTAMSERWSTLVTQPTKPRVVIAPFTTRPQKHWPVAHWVALIELLQDRYQLVLLGGPGDTEAALTLSAQTSALINWAGQTSLIETYALISQADALIGVDTGLTHMGVAAQIPTVAIFGSTCPYQQPLSDRVVILYEALSCAPCHRKPTCNGRFDCLSAIEPRQVQQALESLL